ncbi:MAG: hypothetical protein IKM66_06790 [Clostridia bacterium]|nr:hypothetical protein [Clostridia bacterium]
MSNFNEFLTKIKTAVYGKDVRTAIHDALSYLYKNMSGVYTLPAASASELGGVKLSQDVYLDDEQKLCINGATSEIVELSTTKNTALYEAFNKLATKAHIITSESLASQSQKMIVQICIAANSYSIPVYRIFNSNVWSDYIPLAGYGLSSDFKINENSELEMSLAFKLSMLSLVGNSLIPEDISSDFILSYDSDTTISGVKVFKQGNIISGSMYFTHKTTSDAEIDINENYKPLHTVAFSFTDPSACKMAKLNADSNFLTIAVSDLGKNIALPVSFMYICQ